MRITRVCTTIVNAEMRNWIFVRVDTDSDGLFGWGEATCEWKTRAVAGAIDDLQPLLIGRDPRDIEQLVRVMKKHSFWRLGIIGMSAVSGIEIALWDILGKFLNQPVWRLLGGKVRDRVKVYTHLGLGDMRAVYESNDARSNRTARAGGGRARIQGPEGSLHSLYALPCPVAGRGPRCAASCRESGGPWEMTSRLWWTSTAGRHPLALR